MASNIGDQIHPTEKAPETLVNIETCEKIESSRIADEYNLVSTQNESFDVTSGSSIEHERDSTGTVTSNSDSLNEEQLNCESFLDSKIEEHFPHQNINNFSDDVRSMDTETSQLNEDQIKTENLDAAAADKSQCDTDGDRQVPARLDDTPMSVDKQPKTESCPDDTIASDKSPMEHSSEMPTAGATSFANLDESVGKSLIVELPPLDGPSSSFQTNNQGATASASIAHKTVSESVYQIKWIEFKSNKVPVITQNENGPCPLLAVMNVLLLQGKVKLAPMMEFITPEQVMTYLGDCIFQSAPKNVSESVQRDYEQNMHDAMAVIHKLQTGLDVNVRFTGVRDFEYTPECIIFDLLSISLYHGWLVDPQDRELIQAVNSCSYNQLVEKIIAQKSSDDEKQITEALIGEAFLERTASQLTYHGLCELSNSVRDEEICVFFRNNHFGTLYCRKSELFLLVTDLGFLTEFNVVWETLSNVEGDCHFVDPIFRTYTKPEPIIVRPPPSQPEALISGGGYQIDNDYLVALSLQQDQQMPMDPAPGTWEPAQKQQQTLQQSDHDFALRLQEEENQRAALNAAQQPRSSHPTNSSGSRRPREREREKEKDKSCHIL